MPSNFSRHGKRQRQTRLTFDPVEPSSSATMSPARIRYDASSSSAKILDLSSPTRAARERSSAKSPKTMRAFGSRREKNKRQDGVLPFQPSSPIKSSGTQVRSNSDDFDSDIQITPSSKRRKISEPEVRSSRPPYSSSSTDSSDSEDPTAQYVSFMPRPKPMQMVDLDETGDTSDELPINPRRKKQMAAIAALVVVDEDSEESILESASTKKVSGAKISGARSSRDAVAKQKSITISEDDNDDPVLPTPRRTQKSSPRRQPTSEEDDDAPIRSSQRKRGTVSYLTTGDEDETDDDLPPLSAITSSTRKRRGHIPVKEPVTLDSDSDDIRTTSPLKRTRPDDAGYSEESEEDEPVRSSPAKRRRRGEPDRAYQSMESSPTSKRSQNKDTPSKRITRQQQTKRPHRTQKQKTMELLRRKRAGEQITELTSSGTEEDEPKHGLYDSDSELPALSEFEDEESEAERNVENVRQAIRGTGRNEYDDDFVVEDDEQPLGVPDDLGLNQIPLEFTSAAHRPLKEHFRFVVEWMVQRKINPAFNREDPTYVLAFRKIDDEVRGYANSKFTSSVWKEGFTRALYARPTFYEQENPSGGEGELRSCDACGRTKHPAKFIVRFGGPAYDKHTLDEIDNSDDDEDSGKDDDHVSVNSKGQEIPKEDVVWYVGRFCKDNAETAHSLIHWKHALNSWVEDNIKNEGHLEPEKLAEREEWNKKKKDKYAIAIVDDWEAGKQIRSLWRDFKNQLDQARMSTQSKFRTSRGG